MSYAFSIQLEIEEGACDLKNLQIKSIWKDKDVILWQSCRNIASLMYKVIQLASWRSGSLSDHYFHLILFISTAINFTSSILLSFLLIFNQSDLFGNLKIFSRSYQSIHSCLSYISLNRCDFWKLDWGICIMNLFTLH